MSIEVISSGLWTTIQDRGRYGYAKYGIPKSGAMDTYAAKIANLLVGNSVEKALMEITVTGPILRFYEGAYVALAGLDAQMLLNNNRIELNKPFWIKGGDRLHIKQITKGVRAYLAVKGGFQTDRILDSRSFYKPITPKNKLEKGDRLHLLPTIVTKKEAYATIHFAAKHYDSETLRVFCGPEWPSVSKDLKEKLLNTAFTISKNNNRQAYQLNELMENKLKPILTQPVLPGTVQFTPAGNLIILNRDCQTTGGYPRILQVSAESLNLLAQKRTGEHIQFELIE